MDETVPQAIGPYTIIRLLSEEGQGRTYLGKHPVGSKGYVTIRVFDVPLATDELREAFLTRAKLLKKLKHRHIAEVIDFGLLPSQSHRDQSAQQDRQPDRGYLAMQYVQGKSMREQVEGGRRLKSDEVKRVLSPMADALQYAHSMRVAHGNLHPGNIISEEGGLILLAGFAPLPPECLPIDANDPDALPYMAPEQLAGQPGLASDQYALAVMVYEWLCGQRPYGAAEREGLLRQQREEPLPAPTSVNKDISPAIERVLLKALSLDPQQRFPHTHTFAHEYLRALMGFPMSLDAPTQAGTSSPAPPAAAQPAARADKRRDAGKEALASPGPAADAAESPPAKVSPRAKKGRKAAKSKASPPVDAIPPAAGREAAGAGEKNDDVETIDRVPTEDGYHQADEEIISVDDAFVPQEDYDFADEYADSSNTDRERPKVKRFSKQKVENLAELVAADLSQGGVLSQRLPGYEERQAQLEMAVVVAEALTKERHAVIEASTGTGKTIAYLIPLIRSGRGAIISTANKALQEQLFYKDIPFVQKNVQEFDAALVKGVGNYICLDRLNAARQDPLGLLPSSQVGRLWDITQEFELTISGDFETIGFTVSPEVRSRVNVDRDECAWEKCDFYEKCYARAMKVRAGRAQIIVVNHTLLLLDAAAGGFILPQREVTVVDEAHHLEEEATSAFTVTVNQSQVYALLALTRLRAHTAAHLQDEARKQAVLAWDELERTAQPGVKGRINLRKPVEEALKLSVAIEKLAKSLEEHRPLYMDEKEEMLYDRLVDRTRTLASNTRHVFSVKHPETYIYYVETLQLSGRQRVSPLQVCAAPLDVAQQLRADLFDPAHVIATSATLTTVNTDPSDPRTRGPTFAYFRKRAGLDRSLYPDVIERNLPLSFDYEHNALLYLPRHLPVPAYGDSEATSGYTKAIADEMMRLVAASRGRAFLLFSSKRMLDAVLQEFYTRLPLHLNLRLLRQGDMSRLELVKTFRTTEGAVLFGLRSFWEGVDIAGEALSLVVIDKLPFDPPDDPVHEARVKLMKERGEDWFGSFVLPQAVLRLKQGLGRLLRSHEDRGVMAILDTRLYSKGYGKRVLDALPPARRTHDIRDVEQFFEEEEDEDAPF